jgi:hypothetical protein
MNFNTKYGDLFNFQKKILNSNYFTSDTGSFSSRKKADPHKTKLCSKLLKFQVLNSETTKYCADKIRGINLPKLYKISAYCLKMRAVILTEY